MRELVACCPRGVRQPLTLYGQLLCRAGGACFCAGWPDHAEALSKMAFASAGAYFLTSLIGLLWRASAWAKYIALSTVAAAALAWPFEGALYHKLAEDVLPESVFSPLLDADFLSGELGWHGPCHQCCGEGACTCLLASATYLTTCTQLRDALQMTCSASAGGITRSSLRC